MPYQYSIASAPPPFHLNRESPSKLRNNYFTSFVLSPLLPSLPSSSPAVPVVSTETPDLIGVQGRPVALQFTISADIPPVATSDIVWTFTNTSGATSTLTVDDGLSPDRLTLNISAVEYSDEGTYTLTASNVAGAGMATITLDVRGKESTSVDNNISQ